MLAPDACASVEGPPSMLAASAEPPAAAAIKGIISGTVQIARKVTSSDVQKVAEGHRMPSPPLAARSTSSLPRSASILEPSADEPDLLDPAHRQFCVSIYPYVADKNDELSFAEGQVIRVVRQVNGGWWEGQLGEQVGWFPANHVKKHGPVSEGNDALPTVDPTLQQLDDFRLCTILRNNEIRASTSGAGLNESADDAARIRVLEHILAMEKQYVETLSRFMEEFVHPLAEEEWFPPRDHQAVFGNMAEIMGFEKDLCTMLTHSIAVEHKMGACLLSMTDRFKQVYEEYCANLPQAVTVSTLYARNASMGHFLQSTSANSSPPILHLVSALHKPAQWKNRFLVALHDLLDVTPQNHADRESLNAASGKLDAIVKHIEQVKSGNENQEVVQTLMGQILAWEVSRDALRRNSPDHVLTMVEQGPRLEFFGDLVIEGTLKLSDGVRKRERRFYLLERLLLILKPEHMGKPGEIKFRVVERLPLSSAVLISVPETQDAEGGSLSFQLSYQTDDVKVKSLSITAFNLEQKEKWIASITRQLEGNVGDDDYRIGLSGSKSERSLKWLSSWSEKMRKKRPSIPRLKDLVTQPDQLGHSRADSAPLRTSACRSGSASPPNRIAGRSHSATDIAHSVPARDGLRPHGPEDRSSIPAKHRSSPARAAHSDSSPPASVFTTLSRGRSSLRSLMHSSRSRTTLVSTSGDREDKLANDRGDTNGRSLDVSRSRPPSSYTASITSPSSSPASFLWMQTDVGGGNAAPQTPAPETLIISSEPKPEYDRKQSVSSVNQNIRIAAPVAKGPPHIAVQALERQADLQDGCVRKTDAVLLEPSPATPEPKQPASDVSQVPKEPIAALPTPAAQGPEALLSHTRASDSANFIRQERKEPSGADGRPPSPVDEISIKNRWSHVSRMTVEAPVTEVAPIPERSRRPTVPLYPNRSNPSVSVLSETSFSDWRSPEHWSPSMSVADFGAPRQPHRKSSVANLVQGVKGSLKTLFRRSQSNNALQTPQPRNQDQPQASTSRPPLGQEKRKSSLMDVKDFFFKSRRASTVFLPNSHSTYSLSARGTPREPFAPTTAAVPDMQTEPARFEPVIMRRRMQPAHVMSPPHSTRTSFENVDGGGSPLATVQQKYASLSGCQVVPLPSPLPSAPSSRASLVFVSPEPAVTVDVPVATAHGADEALGQSEVRTAPDSGVYGLLNGAPGKDAVDVPYHFPSRATVASVEVADGNDKADVNSLSAVGADQGVPDDAVSSATTGASPGGGDEGDRHSGRLRSQSLTVERPCEDDLQQHALRAEGDSSSKRVRATSHPHRVLRRARSNLGAFTKTKTAPAATTADQSAANDALDADADAGVAGSRKAPAVPVATATVVTASAAVAAEEYGPVMGQLERRWYTDLAQKCEAMSLEIRELKNHLQAISEDKEGKQV
ncbi:Rho guanine nucleotide exchange factor 6 [Geranomyces variabilis]|uniref:Rho guanine nucleotide exchange factor 6 n=1 Tax=Geranomyces variabilis TaxID=109894 RepID=A0AAD5TIX8_9FUNG|nr:Rho guanine nucleotide exchange factor 6 [Geranomyces variabilis]